MDVITEQHLGWIARSFGRRDYLPLLPSDIEVLSKVGEAVSKHPGTHLFKEGTIADAAYLVRTGEVELYRGPWSSKRLVGRVGAGSVLGDIAMFGRGSYISSARAVGHVDAFRLDRDRLLPHLSTHPMICMRWLLAGLEQLEGTQRRVLRLMHKTVLAQVSDLVAEEARHSPRVEISQAAIAVLLGVTRQSVNQAVARLRAAGVVATGYRKIEVLDAGRLAAIAGGGLDLPDAFGPAVARRVSQ